LLRIQNTNVFALERFFCSTLLNCVCSKVRRWTKRAKVDIFSRSFLVVPINQHRVHWVLAIVDMCNCVISYYDSMGSPNIQVEWIFWVEPPFTGWLTWLLGPGVGLLGSIPHGRMEGQKAGTGHSGYFVLLALSWHTASYSFIAMPMFMAKGVPWIDYTPATKWKRLWCVHVCNSGIHMSGA
jgi:hypothetical protein